MRERNDGFWALDSIGLLRDFTEDGDVGVLVAWFWLVPLLPLPPLSVLPEVFPPLLFKGAAELAPEDRSLRGLSEEANEN